MHVTGGEREPGSFQRYVGDSTVDYVPGRSSTPEVHLKVRRKWHLEILIDPSLGPHEVYDIPDTDKPNEAVLVLRFWISTSTSNILDISMSGPVIETPQ